jgi:hypothetical protein
VGVVIVGVTGYLSVVNKIKAVEDENLSLESAILDIGKNEEKIEEKLIKMEKNLNHLIEQHNTLARDFEGLSIDITKERNTSKYIIPIEAINTLC